MKHNLKVFAVAVTAMAVIVMAISVLFKHVLGLEPNTLRGAIVGAVVGLSIASVASVYYGYLTPVGRSKGAQNNDVRR